MKINMQPRLNKMDTIYFRVSPPEHTFRTCRHSKAYAPVTLHYNIKTVLPFISIYVEHIIIIFFSRWITTVPYYISRSSLVRVVQHYPHYYYRKKNTLRPPHLHFVNTNIKQRSMPLEHTHQNWWTLSECSVTRFL